MAAEMERRGMIIPRYTRPAAVAACRARKAKMKRAMILEIPPLKNPIHAPLMPSMRNGNRNRVNRYRETPLSCNVHTPRICVILTPTSCT